MKAVLFLLALIFVAGCVQYTTTTAPATTVAATTIATTTAQATTVATTVSNTTTTTIPAAKEVAVNITSAGFSPASVEINKGDTVTWTNKAASPRWPASAVHPTHDVYPESGGCIGSKFDACKGLSTGEKFSFVFSQAGTWKYHDHLNTGFTGTVIVK